MTAPDRNVLRGRLQNVFREVFDDDTIVINDAMTSDELSTWDSLNHIILVVTAEKEFGLRLNTAEIGKLADVGSLLDILVARSTR